MAHWALITGGSQRIGAHIARILHQHGWHIAIHCHQGLAQAKQLASELNQHRVDSACVFQADLSDDAARMTFAAEMMAALPHLNVLINNAAVFSPPRLTVLRHNKPERYLIPIYWHHIFWQKISCRFYSRIKAVSSICWISMANVHYSTMDSIPSVRQDWRWQPALWLRSWLQQSE